jgi:LPXTG-motif cell wall-anchored protein
MLAKETNETVLSTPAVLIAAPLDTLKAAPLEAVTPAGETVNVAQVVTPPAPAAAPAPVLVAALPKTASDLGAIGLAGMMLLGAGLLLSGFAKKRM